MRVAGVEGLEPSHAGIKIRCLNQLGYTPIFQINEKKLYETQVYNTILPKKCAFTSVLTKSVIFLTCQIAIFQPKEKQTYLHHHPALLFPSQ